MAKLVSASRPLESETGSQQLVLPLLLVGYAAFYLCRANTEPALNMIAVEHGYDNEQLGVVMAIALGAYAVGKLVLSPFADLCGGKHVLVTSLLGTAFISFAIALSDAPRRFGAAQGLLVIGALVVANRFVQAGGWGGVVHVVGVTFDASRRGTVMGILSTSYDIGNVVALVLSAALVEAGAGWRALFTVNPAIVLFVAIVLKLALRLPPRTPASDDAATDSSQVERVDEQALPSEAGEQSPASCEDASFSEIARHLARQPSFWFATALSFLLTFVRAGFMTWTPRFLYEVSVGANVRSAISSSIAKSAFFGVAGMIGSLVTGRLSDRLGPGRRAPVMTASLGLLLLCTFGLAHAGVKSPLVATMGVAACGLFLLGPYSLLAGAVSLDVAGRRGAATAAGFIDAVGYLGASLAAFILGTVSKRAGWTAAFDVVGGVTLAALLLSTIWALRRARRSTA